MKENKLNGINDSLSKISYILILVSIFIIPFFFIPVSFLPAQFSTVLIFSVSTVLSVLIYLVSIIKNGTVEFPHEAKKASFYILSVPIISITSFALNNGLEAKIFGYGLEVGSVGFVVLSFLYLYLVSFLFRSRDRIFYTLFLFVVSSVVVAAFILLRLIFGDEFLSFGLFNTLSSTVVGGWGSISTFFGICVILSAITCEMIRVNKVIKIMLSFAIVLSLFFMALFNFLPVWIGVGITAFVFILYKIFDKDKDSLHSNNKRKIPAYSTVILLVSVFFIVFNASLGNALSSRFGIQNNEISPTFKDTTSVFVSVIHERSFLGMGPNSFNSAWSKYMPESAKLSTYWNIPFNHGSGLLPTFVINTGILGLISWVMFLGFFWYTGIRVIFGKVEDLFKKYLLVSSFFVSQFLWIMAVLFVPSSIIYILTMTFTGLFFAAIYISNLSAIDKKNIYLNPRTGFVSSVVVAIFLVLNLALGYGVYLNLSSGWHYLRGVSYLNNGDSIELAEKNIVKAINTEPLDAYFRSLTEVELYKLRNILMSDSGPTNQEELQKKFSDTLSDAIKAGMSAKDSDQKNYLNWIVLGKVYESVYTPQIKIDGAYEKAIEAYTNSLQYNPNNPEVLLSLAKLSYIKGDLDNSRKYINDALNIKKNYLEAYFLLSQIEVENNNLSSAIKSVESAILIDPNNPAIIFQLGLLQYNNKDIAGAIESLKKAISLAPDYANAKYFLGLSYETTGKKDLAIKEFQDIKITNPESKEVDAILSNLLSGKPIFDKSTTTKPEKRSSLPIKENMQ